MREDRTHQEELSRNEKLWQRPSVKISFVQKKRPLKRQIKRQIQKGREKTELL